MTGVFNSGKFANLLWPKGLKGRNMAVTSLKKDFRG